MSTKIIKHKTLKEYLKKYRHNTGLAKIKESEVFEFDKKHNCKNQKYLLSKKSWWLIDGTYYEVPKTLGHNWFRNLHKGVQIATCAITAGLLVGGATCGYLFGYYNNNVVVDSSSSSNINIVSVKTNANGDKLIETKGKEGSTPTVSIDVYKGNDKLVINEEYNYTTVNSENDRYIITVYKHALDKHFGPIKVVSNNQKKIVVKPGVVNCNIGDTIELQPYVDDQPFECFWDQQGEQECLQQIDDNKFEAIVVGHSQLIAYKRGYVKAIVPVTVTSDKKIVIDQPKITGAKVGDDYTISCSLENNNNEDPDFTFTAAGSCVSVEKLSKNTCKIHVKKSDYGIVYVECGPYYATCQIYIDSIEINGDRNLAIASDEHQYTAENVGQSGGQVTWSLEGLTSDQATITSDGKLTLIPEKISSAISAYVVATKEQEVSKFEISIGSFDQLDFEVDRREFIGLVKSKESGGSKTATGKIYIPKYYYDDLLDGFIPVRGFAVDETNKIGAFTGCTGITEVVLHENIKSIGSYAFKGCTGMSKLVIPGSVDEFGKEIIEGSGITQVQFNDTKNAWILFNDAGEYDKAYTPSATDYTTNAAKIKETNTTYTWERDSLSITGLDEVKVGQTILLSNAYDDTVWKSGDIAKATIDKTEAKTITVTGVEAGEVYIFAEHNGYVGAKKITVA